MRAYEINAKLKDGKVKIPDGILPKESGDVKLIVMINDEQSKKNYDPEKMKKVLDKMKKVKMFKNIEDPVEWQRKLRDEWQ
jgi:hypothetical protein